MGVYVVQTRNLVVQEMEGGKVLMLHMGFIWSVAPDRLYKL